MASTSGNTFANGSISSYRKPSNLLDPAVHQSHLGVAGVGYGGGGGGGSIDTLRTVFLEKNTGEESITYAADGTHEINMYTSGTDAASLRLQITDSNTNVMNTLNVDKVTTTVVQSGENDHSVYLRSNDGSTNIRFVPHNAAISYLQNYGTLAFTKIGEGSPTFAIHHTDGQKSVYTNAEFNINVTGGSNTFRLYKCPGGEQVSLYSHSGLNDGFLLQKGNNDEGVKVNQFHNGAYRPIYLNSANVNKLVIGTEQIQSDTEKFIVDSTSRFKNGLTTAGDINIEGTNKLHFSSNNYFQNDVHHNLNLKLADNRNFIADTGNDKSSYDFKIEGNSVLKLTRDLTSNTTSDVTQVSSQILSVKDDGVAGGYVHMERTGVSNDYAGLVSYYNTAGRVFYTGFNQGNYRGSPVHHFENQCGSYAFKNSVAEIMSIVSYDGNTLDAASSFVRIRNLLKCPTLQMYASHVDGSVPADSVTSIAGEINSKTSENSDTGRLTLSAGGGTDATTKSRIDIYGSDVQENRKMNFRIGDQVNMTIEANAVSVPNLLKTNNVFPTFNNSYDLGSASLRYNDVYSTNLNFSTCDATGQCNIATILCSADFITGSNCNIKLNGITESKSIIPLAHDQYNIGASNNFYNAIYCDVLNCESGYVGGVAISSDRRLKTDIVDLNPKFGLDFVNKMRPVSYTYKGKSRTHFGVIADEIYDVLQTDKYSIWSKLKDEQGTQTIQTQEFIGVFIKSIQELNLKNEKQSHEIEEMKLIQMESRQQQQQSEQTQEQNQKQVTSLQAEVSSLKDTVAQLMRTVNLLTPDVPVLIRAERKNKRTRVDSGLNI